MVSQELITELQLILKEEFDWKGNQTKARKLGEFLVKYYYLLDKNNNAKQNL